MIWNTFDMAYYINLDSRPDRRALFEQRALEAGIDQLIRFPAIHLTMEEANALPDITKHDGDETRHLKVSSSMSHFAVIREAKERGYESVLIFEDDAVFAPEFETRVKPFLDELRAIPDWDLCYFGGSPEPDFHIKSEKCIQVSDNLYFNPGAVWCIHAYAISHRFYDKVLAKNPAGIYPMDLFFIHYPATDRKYLITGDLLVWQDDESFSDVSKGLEPRLDIFKTNYAKYIR